MSGCVRAQEEARRVGLARSRQGRGCSRSIEDIALGYERNMSVFGRMRWLRNKDADTAGLPGRSAVDTSPAEHMLSVAFIPMSPPRS